MKQLLNNFRSGEVLTAEVPVPLAGSGTLLIRSAASAISIGTERMLVDFAKAGYIEKARQQPEKVRMVIDKVRTDGPAATFAAVKSKLDQPIPLGYSNVGYVVEVGAGVRGFSVGDLVLSNGAHAEFVRVPANLCARVPENVNEQNAAYGVIASIALQGVRLAQPTLGETVVVLGLGLIGLIAVQILLANGCQVIGIDLDAAKVERCRALGATGLHAGDGASTGADVQRLTGGNGADAVLLTLATTSSKPVRDAAHMCRKRGRIVLVGVTGLELERADFYEKELSFQVSCSYGPGRYDPNYEDRGHDYPIGFVRWTEQRNFQAVLQLMANGSLDCRPLTTDVLAFDSIDETYPALFNKPGTLGAVITYADVTPRDTLQRTIELEPAASRRATVSSRPGVAVVGAGAFASQVLLPALARCDAALISIVSSGGVTGSYQGRKHQFRQSTSDFATVLDDPEVQAVVIASRHNQHAGMICACLEAGKSVYVEKPLALDHTELADIRAAYTAASKGDRGPILMVGYNRRFSPHIVRAKKLLAARTQPMSITYLCNAGEIPADHWVHDVVVGGGRLIGEGCHMLDLMMHLSDSMHADLTGVGVCDAGQQIATPDIATVSFSFADGSIGTLHYFANGSKAFPKERITVFNAGQVLEIDNFRSLRTYGVTDPPRQPAWRQNKGHEAAMQAFVAALANGHPSPTDFEQIMAGAATMIDASARAADLLDAQRSQS